MSRPRIVEEPSPDHLQAFLASWPPGIGRLETTDGDVFGLLMRRGVDVVWCRAAVFETVQDPFDLADRVAQAVLHHLAAPRPHALAAAAFVVGEADSQRVGVATFCFDASSELQPGAGGGDAATALANAVSHAVGVAVGPMQPRPYDQIGTYRLQGVATPQGLLFVGRSLPDEHDALWQDWPSDDPIVHLPSVGFAEDASEDDA